MIAVRAFLFTILASSIFLHAHAQRPGGGGGGTGLPTLTVSDLPLIDLWGQDRFAAERLDFGESINLDNGQLSFLVTDVQLPGNSDLQVGFGRRIGKNSYLARGVIGSLGMGYNNSASGVAYTKWIADIPIITGVAKGGAQYNQEEDIPYQGGQGFLGWTGVYMSIPGQQVRKLNYARAPNPAFAQGHRYATEDNWVIKRFEGTNPTFEARSPDGTKYTFNHVINDAYQYTKGGGIIAATQVTDVHGNWVKYEYAGTQVTRIHANDGREITIAYSPGVQYQANVVTSVSANGRTWTYQYNSSGDLYRVNLPDGRYWQFDNVADLSTAITACTWLTAGPRTVGIRHPTGMYAQYTIESIYNGRIITAADVSATPGNYQAGFLSTGCQQQVTQTSSGGVSGPAAWMSLGYVSHAVRQKTITVPRSASQTWGYQYDQDFGAFRGNYGLALTKSRTITKPDGTKETLHFSRVADWREGLLEKVETKSASGSVLETRTRTYQKGPSILYQPIPVHPTWSVFDNHQRYAKLLLSEITNRGGDTYTVTNEYDADASLPTFDYGAPKKVTKAGSMQAAQRIFEYDYLHYPANWILGLTTSVMQNSVLTDSFTYSPAGQVTAHNRFGATAATYGYFASGTAAGRLNWHRNALNQQTTLSDYKRGVPQSITRRDGVTVSQVVDNNGWITSQTDGRTITTGYQYNSMGWLTKVDRPAAWADSTIVYSSLGNGVVQTETRGNFLKEETLDGLLRPILGKTQSLIGSAPAIYVKTEYDGLGRAVFRSFPSFSPSPASGVSTNYDALGRVTQLAENVSPNATTATAYLANNCVRVTDPVGAQTTTCRSGYGSPEDGGPVSISQPAGISTAMTYDIFGNLTAATQSGGGKSFTQAWAYDARLRPCAFAAPETGKTLYSYYSADQLTAYAEGLTGTACATLPADKVSLTYDAMGRLLTTNYPGTAPDINRTYNANGSPLTVSRGGIDWVYTYHPSAELPASATLTVDARTYPQAYGYNPEQVLSSYTLPSGKSVTHSVDGFGRVTGVTLDGANIASAMSYHPNGALAGMTYGNGQVFSQTQTTRQMPLNMRSVRGTEVPVDLTYTYTARGQVSSIDDQSPFNIDQTFTYDGARRLVASTGPWGAGTFSYDALGNLVQRQVGSRFITLSYNAANRLASHTDTAGGPRSLSYDARGNVTALGGLGFAYDASNQPTWIGGSAVADTWHRYDGHLRRVHSASAVETRYSVYDLSGGLVSVDQVGAGPTEYIRASGMTLARVVGASVTWLHPDHLGSALAGTGITGSVVWRESEQPFGEDWISFTANDNQAGYTGHVEDAGTGLIYMQARYYDPVIGRFLANDPVGFSPGRPDMFNRYSYAANDPVNMTDPDGKCAGPAAIPCYFAAKEAVVAGLTIIAGLFVVTQTTTDDVFTNDNASEPKFPDRKSAEDRITSGAKPDWETGQRKGYDSPPTGETADEIFGDITSGEGVEVNQKGGEQGDVEVATLPDGSKVIDRNSSSGVRTIETQTRTGKTKVEVRFPKDPKKQN